MSNPSSTAVPSYADLQAEVERLREQVEFLRARYNEQVEGRGRDNARSAMRIADLRAALAAREDAAGTRSSGGRRRRSAITSRFIVPDDALAVDVCKRLCDMAGEPRLFIPGEVKAVLRAALIAAGAVGPAVEMRAEACPDCRLALGDDANSEPSP